MPCFEYYLIFFFSVDDTQELHSLFSPIMILSGMPFSNLLSLWF